jgi:hypothetical protein
LLGDLISDPTATRRFSYSPHLLHWYQNGTDTERYSVMRTLLKWTCVTRSRGKKLALPHQPWFALYRHLHKMVACFPAEEQRLVDDRAPSFHHALRSFLQLEEIHYISRRCLVVVQRCLEQHPALRALFPQVDMLTQVVPQDGTCSAPIGLEQVPGHAFLYGMALHPRIPAAVRKMIFLHVDVRQPLRRPARCKPAPTHTIARITRPFATFLHQLEQRSFMAPDQRSKEVTAHVAPRLDLDSSWVVRCPEFTSDTLNHHGLEDRCIEPRYG